MAARTVEREEFLADIISTAIEGGIGYWAETRHYQWVNNGVPQLVVIKAGYDPDLKFEDTRAVIVDFEGENPNTEREITIDVIARGIAKIKDPKFRINKTLRGTILAADVENDAGEIDVEGADVIVQAALFGEIVYG